MNRAADFAVGGWQTNGILTLAHRPAVSPSAAPSARVNGAGACPIWFPAHNPECQRLQAAAVLEPTANGSITSAFQVAYQNAATGVYTGGNLGLQSQHRSADPHAGFLALQGLRVHGDGSNCSSGRKQSTSPTRRSSASRTQVSATRRFAANGTLPAINGNGNFGKVLGANVGTERHVQFQLRLQF